MSKNKQQHVFHGGKEKKFCVIRKGASVFPPEEFENSTLAEKCNIPSTGIHHASISQAKHFCLDLMKRGFQVREG